MSEIQEITIYVSETGDDADEGSSRKPLGSLAAALDKIRWKSYEKAEIVISGSITEAVAREAMIDITGKGLPPLFLRGESSERPGILSADELDKRVLYISDGNSVSLMDNLVIRGGTTRGSGGSGVCIEGGTLILVASEIADNDAGTGMGGGVYVGRGGEFIMYGGSIVRNNTIMSGGGVFSDDGGVFTMYGGLIADNTAYLSGAGVFVGLDSVFALHGGVIEKNRAGGEKGILLGGIAISYGKGGGVYICRNASLTMDGGEISENRAIAIREEADDAGSGGGVYVEKGGVFTLQNGTIKQNGVMAWGGGVYTEGAFTTCSDSAITNNIARLGGGGVHVAGKTGVFTMKGGLLMNNYSGGSGGAVNIMENSVFTMERGIIVKNAAATGNALAISGKAVISGGGIFDNNGASKENEAGLEAASPAIVIEETGKLTISGGELDAKIAMKEKSQLEDIRDPLGGF
ncbi:hypothetical protein AGMMS49940_01310 [Spirochaetia bacterium]|nr:hypothetical protein AGMMS49940_01310 [Spirochaetia bacterium]